MSSIGKLALRTHRESPALDPGGRGKGLDTVRARLATVRARLTTVRARLARIYLKNSTLVYQPTLLKNNLSIKKLVVIMLIYVLFFRWFSGERCVGVGGVCVGDWVGDGY